MNDIVGCEEERPHENRCAQVHLFSVQTLGRFSPTWMAGVGESKAPSSQGSQSSFTSYSLQLHLLF